MIKLNNISFSYNNSHQIFSDMSFEFKEGIYYITGKNGSGKTTLLKLIMGLLKPSKGEIIINNQNNTKLKRGEIGKLIGYMSSEVKYQLFANCVYDEIFFPLEYIYGKERAEAITVKTLKKFNLIDLLDREPLRLSDGEKKRVLLSCITTLNPCYYVFDEPSSSLDSYNKVFLQDFILEESKTKPIIIATHDSKLIEEVKGKSLQISREGLSEI